MNTENFSEVFSKMISRKMNEKLYELENYRAIMSKRVIEARKQDHTIHGYMDHSEEMDINAKEVIKNYMSIRRLKCLH